MPITKVGDIFLEFSGAFKLYAPYLNNYGVKKNKNKNNSKKKKKNLKRAIQTIEDLRKLTGVNDWLKNMENQNKSIMSLLIMPVQRMPSKKKKF